MDPMPTLVTFIIIFFWELLIQDCFHCTTTPSPRQDTPPCVAYAEKTYTDYCG